jgi:hypothetical protein
LDLSTEVRQGRMRKTSVGVQELRRKIYSKAKTEGLRLEAVEQGGDL